MKRPIALVAVVLAVAGLPACNEGPIEQIAEPGLTLSADSVTVDVGAFSSVRATVSNTTAPAQFVSRDQNVATVNANGAISGVAIGSTYVVATLSNHPHIRDSVRVRVQTQLSAGAAADSAFVRALRAQLQGATQAGQFSGAVLVTRNGSTLFEGAYGLANREQNEPNTLLTQFRVGSMNKMMTAVATLQLVQAGTLSLNTPFSTYVPNYPNADMSSKVTPHHLLTHTGGTGDIFGPQFMANRTELQTVDDYLQLYGTRALQFTPGAQHVYSNYGFMLLGAIIERVTGKSYYDQVAASVLAPANMTATGFLPEDELVPGRAVGYTRQIEPGTLVSNAPTLPYRGTPAGGGYSTVGDFAHFAVALKEHRLLDATHTTQLITGKVLAFPGVQYAYGFMDRVVGGRRFVGHSGGAAGMSGDLAFEPNGGYVVVVLSNFDPPAATQMSAFILNSLPAN
jgi:D-alanyl-D-alanine carboxypeptidase